MACKRFGATCLMAGLVTWAPGAGADDKDAAREIAQAAPGSEIFLAKIERGKDTLRFAKPSNATHRPGYDNQPFFLADGKHFYYTSIHEDGQADIWLYDVESGEARRITNTPESEYSPTVAADGNGISTVRVEPDGRQRLFRYGEDGTPGKALVDDEKAVGYHAWMDENTIALYIVGEPSVLKTLDLRSGRTREVGHNVGPSLQVVPARPGVGYIEPNADGSVWIKILQWPAGLTRLLTPPLEGSEHFVLGTDGDLYMARDKMIYIWGREPGKWRVVADYSADLPGSITRLAMNPKADLLAFVVAEEP